VVSPRETNFISGDTSCDTLICVKPICRAMDFSARSWAP